MPADVAAEVIEFPRPLRRGRLADVDRDLTAPELSVDAGDLYRQLAPAVLGYLRSQHLADPEDVLGETFYQVARDIGRFRGERAALRRWVFSIAHNRMIDAKRRSAARPEEPRAEPAASNHAPSADADLVDPELVDALGRLTPDQREVLGLRFVADLRLRDVAQITSRRVGAVKALQTRALEALRRELDARRS